MQTLSLRAGRCKARREGLRRERPALNSDPAGPAREIVLRRIRAVLRCPVDSVRSAGRPTTPVLVGKGRLGLSLAANEAQLLQDCVLVSRRPQNGELDVLAAKADCRVIGV